MSSVPTSPEAQWLHMAAQQLSEAHDAVTCWCCCLDCDFPYKAVSALDALLGIEPGSALEPSPPNL